MDSILFIMACMLIVVGSASAVTAVVGILGRWRWKWRTIIIGSTAVPLALMGYGMWLIYFSQGSEARSDINGLAAFFLFLLPLLLLPFTFVVAAKTFRTYHRCQSGLVGKTDAS